MDSNSTKETGKGKRFIYKFIAVLIPFILLFLFEIILRLFGYGYNLDLFIRHPNQKYKEYMLFNPAIGEKYFQKYEATGGVNDIFLKKKPDNTFRIFVLGSSTAVGFPYYYNLSFPRILHQRLQKVYPDKNFEVVNTAITAINSITLLDYMPEIVRYDPDAILIYAGHNEFYGAFGIGSNEQISKNRFLRDLHFKLMDLRIYQMLRKMIGKIGRHVDEKEGGDVSGTLMKRIVADKEILYGSTNYQTGFDIYASNLEEILQSADDRNIPVFISDLVSNVRDLPPFGSKMSEGLPEADSVYALARSKEISGDYINALALYYQAKDLDCIRFRASEDFNQIIDDLAEEYQVYKVPVLENFRAKSANNLIGDNLMTEHVHPNIDGFFLMAEVFFNNIVNSGIIDSQPDSMELNAYQYFRRTYGYTAIDTLVAWHRIRQIKSSWPFVDFDSKVTHRDTYIPEGFYDELAFSEINFNDITVEEIHDSLAGIYFDDEHYSEALAEYKALICINPYRPEYYDFAANCLLMLNDLYSAEQLLKQTLKYRNSLFSVYALGDIALTKHQFRQAVKYYENALELTDDDEKEEAILKNLAIAYYYADEPMKSDDIVELLDKEFEIDYTIPELLYEYPRMYPETVKEKIELSQQLEADEKDEEAIAILEEALDHFRLPILYRQIGDILKRNRDSRFLVYYQQAYPDYSEELLFLKDLCIGYMVNGRTDEARQVYEKIGTLDPESEFKKILSPHFD